MIDEARAQELKRWAELMRLDAASMATRTAQEGKRCRVVVGAGKWLETADEIMQLLEDLHNLQQFVKYCMNASWQGRDMNGGELSDLAERLKLVRHARVEPGADCGAPCSSGEAHTHQVLAWTGEEQP